MSFQLRPLSLDDVPALYALDRACDPVDGCTKISTEAELTTTLTDVKLATDSLAALNAAGEIIGRAWFTVHDAPYQRRYFIDERVNPQYRGDGVGWLLLETLENRILAQELEPDKPVILRCDFYDRAEDAILLYMERGYEFVLAEDTMRRDLTQPLPDYPLPEGYTLHAWSDDLAPQFFTVYEDAFRDRPGFPGWSQAVWVQNFTGYDEFRPNLSLLLTQGDTPISYAVCAVEPIGGMIVQTGMRPAWRRKGLAAALLTETMRRFQAEGLTTANLEVNINNPEATHLYEKLGFVRTSRYTSYQKTIF